MALIADDRLQHRGQRLTRVSSPLSLGQMTPLDGGLGLALFEDRYVQDPYPLYEQMHRVAPVHRIGDSGFYAVSSWDAVNEAVTRCDDFSSNLTATMMYQPGGTVTAFEVGDVGGAIHALATADEPAHSVHRRALLPQLAAKRIRAVEPFIARTAAAVWNANARGSSIEWMGAMANRLPMMIVGRIIGVPAGDIDKLTRWGCSATQLVEGLVSPDQMEAAGVAVMELSGYITEQFQQAATDPHDNLLGDLASACATGDIDNVAALTMMITLFSAGGESTASLIGSAAWILTTQPRRPAPGSQQTGTTRGVPRRGAALRAAFPGPLSPRPQRHRTVRHGAAGRFTPAPAMGSSQSRPAALRPSRPVPAR